MLDEIKKDYELYGRDLASYMTRGRVSWLIAEIERLEAIVGRQQRTADGVLVEDGKPYYFPCANGFLKFVAYLGPQSEHLKPYPWNEGFSTPEAAEAARGKR